MSFLGMFLFLFVITAVAYSDAFYPNGCKCSKRYSSFRVYCQSSSLSYIMQNIPISAIDLYLAIGNVKRITIDDFKNFTELRSLTISAKNLTEIDDYALSHLKNLIILKIIGTKMIAVKKKMLSGLIALETFIIERSKNLKTVDQDLFQEVKQLRRLFLVRSGLEMINNSTFVGLHKLKSLYLQNNQLSSLQAGSFSTLSMLEVLILNYNNIQYLKSETFHGLISLKTLSLKNNKIKAINPDSFSPLSNLLNLNLKNNRIESLSNFTFFNLSKLKALYLENNLISETKENTFVGLLNLEILNLNNNRLKDIKRLLRIDISKMKFQLPTFKIDYLINVYDCLLCEFKKLKSLQLNKNNISSIDKETFSGLSQLQDLHIRDNRISSIDHNAFKDLTQLQLLHLESNQLTHIDGELFYNLKKLRKLHLSYNHLEYLEEGLFAMNFQLRYLHLKNNQLKRFNALIFAPQFMIKSYSNYSKTNSQECADKVSNEQNTGAINDTKIMYIRIGETKKGDTQLVNEKTIDCQQSQRISLKTHFISFHTIDLNENQLTSFPELEWSRFPHLVNVLLRNNSISNLEPSLLLKLQNIRIDLRYNCFKCRCSFQDILKSIQNLFIRITCVLRDEIKDVFVLNCEKLRTGWKEISNFSEVFRDRKDLRENSSFFGLLPVQFQVEIKIIEMQNDSADCKPLSINLSRGYNLELSRFSNFMMIKTIYNLKIIYNSVSIEQTFVPINITQRRHVIQLSQQQDISLDFYFTISFDDRYIYYVSYSQSEISPQNIHVSLNNTQCFRIENLHLRTKRTISHNHCHEVSSVEAVSEYGCNSDKRLQPFCTYLDC